MIILWGFLFTYIFIIIKNTEKLIKKCQFKRRKYMKFIDLKGEWKVVTDSSESFDSWPENK